jgi:hypothetical protein
LVLFAALKYNPPDDTITNRTIVGFILLGVAATVFVVAILAGLFSTHSGPGGGVGGNELRPPGG